MIEIKKQSFTKGLKKKIYSGLSRHAIAMTGYDEKFDHTAFIATDNGSFVGAIVIEFFWGALHIKYLYVEDEYRGKRIGSQLMEYALKYGYNHDCPFAFVETMSFQALRFYQKMGFELELTRFGYKHNTALYYLRKDILKKDSGYSEA